MNEKILKGKWEKVKGNIQKKWGKLTDDDLDVIKGDVSILIGKIKEKYGLKQEEAEKKVREYLKDMEGLKESADEVVENLKDKI